MTSEHAIQSALFEWAAWNAKRYPELRLMFAIPNGGHRHIAVAKRMKAEGVAAGVPDIFLPVARHANGLFIEMKSEKGVLTPKQRKWMGELIKQGYEVVVCRTLEQACEAITEYLA